MGRKKVSVLKSDGKTGSDIESQVKSQAVEGGASSTRALSGDNCEVLPNAEQLKDIFDTDVVVTMSKRIQKLGFDAKSMLESGLVITDATQCAMELVENALDAKCTAVAVRINFKDFIIEVIDNGKGISPDDLHLVGERFMTSKCQNSDDLKKNMETFGHRGQAIASILDVCSQLRIKTKSELCTKTLVKVFTKGKSPTLSVSSSGKCKRGTTVTVFGFMSTMPVRQKRITELFDMREMKNQLEYLALIHNEVCFTLRDDDRGEIILQSRNRINRGLSFADLFGMALGKFLVPLNYAEQKIEIEGFIGLRKHSENNLQFFYVNRRIISKSLAHRVVNTLIDKYLNKKLTLMEESPVAGEINVNANKCCHNVYLVQIRCPYTDFEMFRNLRKTTVEFKNWDRIFYCLRSAFKAVLNCDRSYKPSTLVIRDRKNENLDNLPKKCYMELGQMKCGVQGVFVKRKQCELVLSNNKDFTSRIKFHRRRVINDNEADCSKDSLHVMDEMKTNFPLNNRNLSVFASNNDKMERYADEYAPEIPLHNGGKKLKQEQYALDTRRTGTIANDILIEFAAWLKSKVEDGSFIRNMYMEFVGQKLILCGKKKSSVFPRKRKQHLSNEKDALERYDQKTKPVRAEGEGLNGKKAPISRVNSVENNFEQNQLNNKKVKKLRKGTKLGCDNNLHARNREGGEETVENKFTNDSIKLSFTCTSKFVQSDMKNPTYGPGGGSKNCLVQGESSKSWVSHENRPRSCLNESYMEISQIHSNKRKAGEMKYFVTKKGKNENVRFGSDSGEDIYDKLSAPTSPNNCFKSAKFHRETDITSVNCDKRIQINSQRLNNVPNVYKTINAEENGNNANVISGKTLQDRVASDGLPGEEVAQLKINFGDGNKVINASLPPKTAAVNPCQTREELITCSDSNRCKNICDINLGSFYGERPLAEQLKSNSQMGKSTCNIDSMVVTLCHSLNRIPNRTAQSGDFESQGKRLVTEETASQNLPDTLSFKDEEYRNTDNAPADFPCMERYSFIPKGLSPTVLDRSPIKFGPNDKTIQGMCKAECTQEGKSHELFTKSLLPDECIQELKENTLENMIYYESEMIRSFMTKTESRICASMSTFPVDKDILKNVKVIGQWDRKFIVGKTCCLDCEGKHLLLLFDQHAVDERIRLEKLVKDSRNTEGKFISAKCSPPVSCKLEESTIRLIPALHKILMDFGVSVSAQGSEHALFLEVPVFLMKDNAEDAELFLRKLVKNVVEEFSTTRGASSTIPRVMYDKISTKACKSAVKFNEFLSLDEMEKMINDLIACRSPFHCAHGRPSTVPILDLGTFQNQVTKREEKLNFKKFRIMKST